MHNLQHGTRLTDEQRKLDSVKYTCVVGWVAHKMHHHDYQHRKPSSCLDCVVQQKVESSEISPRRLGGLLALSHSEMGVSKTMTKGLIHTTLPTSPLLLDPASRLARQTGVAASVLKLGPSARRLKKWSLWRASTELVRWRDFACMAPFFYYHSNWKQCKAFWGEPERKIPLQDELRKSPLTLTGREDPSFRPRLETSTSENICWRKLW